MLCLKCKLIIVHFFVYTDLLCAKSGHWPGLQWDVAVEHPAVLQLHWLGCGGPVTRGGRRGVDGVASATQRVAVGELAEDWWCDSVWWLCGGGMGGRRVWLWWFGAPGERNIEKPFYQAVNQLSIGIVKNCVKRCRKCKRKSSSVRVKCNQNKHQIRDERTLSVMTACQSCLCCYSFFPNSHSVAAGSP